MSNSNPIFSISVVIPNYNGKHLLQQNLPYLYIALNFCGCAYEVIIPDDASTDDSITFINQNYPEIQLIKSQTNGGFAANINRGIAAAKMQLVLLLNSDIKLNENYFTNQFKYFEKPETFGVMGLILDEGSGQIAEACKYPKPSVFKINSFKNIVINSTDPVYTFYLSGANALVDRQKLLALNGFNSLFSPFYQEDLDLSLRAWENGWACYFESSAVCYHAVSSTINKHNKKQYIKVINTRNKMVLSYIHLTGLKLFLWLLVTLFSLAIRWAINQSFYYPAARLFIKMLPAVRLYKASFIKSSKQRGNYIPFRVIKNNIYNYLNQLIAKG